ncbi:MAG TPA: hypothetical protein VHB21_25450 [Minicystis sp.]|nr:hypothetical protein [Minicystis sp.]
MNDWNQWYVSVGDTTVGPVSTDLVVRGIEHRKIPVEALVCAVGGTTWMSLGTIAAFHAAVIRSYPPPPPDSDDARYWLAKGFRFPKPAALPVVEIREMEASSPAHDDADVEIDWAEDEARPAVDWTKGFSSFFLGGEPVVLPDDDALLASLAAAPRAIFEHDEALWNLALCLAYGSDRVGEAAARAFFDAILELGRLDRLEWMSRTLQSQGFVPSGIAADAACRAFERLRALCPPALDVPAERVA